MLEQVRTVKLIVGWRGWIMVDQTSEGSHGAYSGNFTGSACLERKETSSWPNEHAL